MQLQDHLHKFLLFALSLGPLDPLPLEVVQQGDHIDLSQASTSLLLDQLGNIDLLHCGLLPA